MEGLGAYIRQLRDERDLSLREFAKKLDVSAPFVSDIELGRRHPSEEVLAKIAQVLGVKVEDLRAHDTRPPIDEIKRMTQSDPKFALAFRRMIDKNITAEDLLDLAKKKDGQKPGNKPKK
jgi:transcriptional regulator with XRE-family HTH domain